MPCLFPLGVASSPVQMSQSSPPNRGSGALQFEVAEGEPRSVFSQRSSQKTRSSRRSTFHDEYRGSEVALLLAAETTDAGESSGSSIPAGAFNLANCIMGSALTGLPYVVRVGGVVPVVIFLTFSWLLGGATLKMLAACGKFLPQGRKMDYQAVGELALGPKGLLVVAGTVCLSTIGALTSYVVLVGSTAPALCKMLGFATVAPWKIQVGLATCLLWPLCLLKDISALAPSSLFALLVFGLMALTSLGVFIMKDDFYVNPDMIRKYDIDAAPEKNTILWIPQTFGLREISQFPTIIMAFNCHYALLPIYENLRSKQPEDIAKVIKGGTGAAFSVYIILALASYLVYRGHTQSMVLLNFRHYYKQECAVDIDPCPPQDVVQILCVDDNMFIKILNGLFLLAVLLGYPCVHFALRKAQIALTSGVDAEFNWAVHAGLATFNIMLTLTVAILVGDDVSVVFRWTGAVASPLVSFILPSLFYFLILGQNGETFKSGQRRFAFAVLVYGLSVVGLGVTCNILVPSS